MQSRYVPRGAKVRCLFRYRKCRRRSTYEDTSNSGQTLEAIIEELKQLGFRPVVEIRSTGCMETWQNLVDDLRNIDFAALGFPCPTRE